MGLPRFLFIQNNYFALRFSRWAVKQTEVILSLTLPISHNSSKWSRLDTQQDVDRWPRPLSAVADIRAPVGNGGWRLLIERRKPKHSSGLWGRFHSEYSSPVYWNGRRIQWNNWTCRGLRKIPAISKTIVSNAFYRTKSIAFWLRFHQIAGFQFTASYTSFKHCITVYNVSFSLLH